MPSTLQPCVSPIRTKARAAAFIPHAGAPMYIIASVYGVCTHTPYTPHNALITYTNNDSFKFPTIFTELTNISVYSSSQYTSVTLHCPLCENSIPKLLITSTNIRPTSAFRYTSVICTCAWHVFFQLKLRFNINHLCHVPEMSVPSRTSKTADWKSLNNKELIGKQSEANYISE